MPGRSRAGGYSSLRGRVVVLQLLAEGVQCIVQPGSGRAVRYPELAGDRRRGASAVEGLDQYGAVFRRQVLQGGGDELPVQDLIEPRVVARIVDGLRLDGDRP